MPAAVAANQLALPNLFEQEACAAHINRLERTHAVRFVGEVLVEVLCKIAQDPATGLAEDPRWKMAVSIANPLSLWGEVRFPKMLAERAARLDRVVRERGLRGPAGLALAAAQNLVRAALYTEHVPRSALVEALALAVRSQVLHAIGLGHDPGQAEAEAQSRLLTMANRIPATVH